MIDSEGADALFRDAIDWLGAHYGSQVFYFERDIAYTLQSHLVARVAAERLPFRVYNDYPIIPGQYRSLSADLALVSTSKDVLLAAEFRYEPCHRRLDLLKTKLPVTIWADLVKDTKRVRQFVIEGRAKVAYAVCIDEGNYLAKRDLSIYEEHRVWPGEPHHHHPISFLMTRRPLLAEHPPERMTPSQGLS
jgi:hypothetical protein